MADPKPLPHPEVRYMFDASGKPTQQAYEFLERLVKVAKDANTSIAALQAGTAPIGASYVLIANDATLTADRALTAGAGISLTDAGANSTATVAVTAGAILQTIQAVNTANTSLTTVLPIDDTTPTNSEGDQVFSQAITPASASNKVLITAHIWGGTSVAVAMALFRGSTCINANVWETIVAGAAGCGSMMYLDSPATTSSTTYSLRIGTNTGAALRLNGNSAGRFFGGTSACTFTLQEIKG